MAVKKALPKMMRGEDGRQKTVFIDMDTGEQIPYENLEEYTVVTAGGTDYYDPTPDGTDTDADENDQNPSGGKGLGSKKPSNRSDGGQRERQEAAGYSYGSKGGKGTGGGKYINKPGWMKFASLIPGPIGMAAKAANVAVNVNNTNEVNEARKSMGLEPLGVGGAVKGALIDQHGQIARVDINGNQYSVGFEAEDKYGRPNLTPREAWARTATPTGVPHQMKEVANTKPAGATKRGIISGAVDSVFGSKTPTGPIGGTKSGGTPTAMNQPTEYASEGDGPFSAYSDAGSLGSAGSPGGGLASPGTPSGRPSMNVQESYGSKRPNPPADSVMNGITRSVQNALGPGYSIRAISGTPTDANSNGFIDPHEHPEGTSVRHDMTVNSGGKVGSLDFDVIDPSGGVVVDKGKLGAVAKDYAANNSGTALGVGEGYMSDEGVFGGRMHLDNTGIGGAWGNNNSGANLDPVVGGEFFAGQSLYNSNTPFNPNFVYEAPTANPNRMPSARVLTDAILDAPLGAETFTPADFQNSLGASLARNVGTLSEIAKVEEAAARAANVRPDMMYDPQSNLRPEEAYGPTIGSLPATQDAKASFGSIGMMPISRETTSVTPGRPNSTSATPSNSTLNSFGPNSVYSGTSSANLSSDVRNAIDSTQWGRPENLSYSTPHVANSVVASGTSHPDFGSAPKGVQTQASIAPGIPSQQAAALGPSLSPTQHVSAFSPGATSKVAAAISAPTPTTQQDRFAGVNIAKASPEQMANLGLADYSLSRAEQSAQRAKYATELAAKLDQATITGIAAGNPASVAAAAQTFRDMMNRETASKTVSGVVGNYFGAQTTQAFDARPGWAKTQAGETRGFTPGAPGTQMSNIPSSGMRSESTQAEQASRAASSGAGPGRGTSPGGVSSQFGQGGSRSDSGIGTNPSAGAGRGSSIGGPSLGGSDRSSGGSTGGGYTGGGPTSGPSTGSSKSGGGYTGGGPTGGGISGSVTGSSKGGGAWSGGEKV